MLLTNVFLPMCGMFVSEINIVYGYLGEGSLHTWAGTWVNFVCYSLNGSFNRQIQEVTLELRNTV